MEQKLKMIGKDKKGILGLDTVKTVMISFLILAVLSIAITLALISLRDAVELQDTITISATNINTATVINDSNFGLLPGATLDFRRCSATVTNFTNVSNAGLIIDAGNYTVTGCVVNWTAGVNDAGFNNSLWNFTGSYVYANPSTSDTQLNITSATTDFFSNTGTIFAILVVVVIIAVIAIVIAIVSRFGGGGGVSVGGGNNSSFGSDTVTGI